MFAVLLLLVGLSLSAASDPPLLLPRLGTRAAVAACAAAFADADAQGCDRRHSGGG